MRLVVRSDDVRAAREAQARLAEAGVEAQALPGPYRPAPDGEDIAIFPASDVGVARQLAEATLRAKSPPMAALLAVTTNAPPCAGLQELSPFLGAVALDAPPKLLAAQIDALLRVASVEEERRRRLDTAAALDLTRPKALAARQTKLLYIGAPSALYLSLERALAEMEGAIEAAFSSFAGFDHLHDDVFDAVVLNGAADARTALSLCGALRKNATLYHMPTMVIIPKGDDVSAATAFERGASAVIEAQAPSENSLAWLFEAIRRERRRATGEHDLRALRDKMGDARTGLFTQAPFETHLARMASDHHASGRPMALAALRVMPAHGAREPTEAIWRKGFAEVGSLAGRLMRETDSGAAIGRDVIAVALPGAALAGAKRTAERIASVAECTAFAAGDDGAAPLIFEQSAVELQPGESGAGLLARAFRALDLEMATG